jgi:hypothetical protein
MTDAVQWNASRELPKKREATLSKSKLFSSSHSSGQTIGESCWVVYYHRTDVVHERAQRAAPLNGDNCLFKHHVTKITVSPQACGSSTLSRCSSKVSFPRRRTR